jgi:transposase InsO family protein
MPRPTHPYIRAWEGWLSLATVLDVFSRRVVGWALTDHLRASLVGDALRMAIGMIPAPSISPTGEIRDLRALLSRRRLLQAE